MTKKNNLEIQFNCLLIEDLVKCWVSRGITDTEKLVELVDTQFHPQNEWEMEMYSEAIIYSKLSILN